MLHSVALKRRLQHAPAWFITLYAAICAFAVYFCMYAFRKPFTVAAFEGIVFWGTSYKVWLVTSQVLGYMFSKFYSIRFISSISRQKQGNTILLLIFFGRFISDHICLCFTYRT
jgi:hypothetical protein